MTTETRWGQVRGIDGNLYWGRYFSMYENSDLADNDGNFRKHQLLEFLCKLGIFWYVHDHSDTYEINMKARE